jgi:hypothetical protein
MLKVMKAVVLFLGLAPAALGDARTQKLFIRLSEEAEKFARIAPQVLGQETLRQRALKPSSGLRLRVGAAAKAPLPSEWQLKEIVSEYAFAGLGGSLHELRKVVSVDGRKVDDAPDAEEALARAITAGNEDRKKQLLKDFEKHGLLGAVTDFGQLILLFHPSSIESYEFTYGGFQVRGDRFALLFTYRQVDGPEALTVIDQRKAGRKGDAKDEKVRRIPIQGEVWVWEDTYVPFKVTMSVSQGGGSSGVRQEATVEYTLSNHGSVLPSATEHRELRGGNVIVENRFTYTDFKKFGASSDIKFDTPPPKP